MIGRRAVIGLSLLSALLFSAFAAQSAFAIKAETSKNTTAFTCVKVGDKTGDFEDAHCDKTHPSSAGDYEHKLIPLDTTTEVDVTNNNVTPGPLGEPTAKSEPAVLKGKIALAKVTIECTTVKNNVKKSTVHNVEPSAGQHTFTGTVETEFTNCNVKELSKCTVSEPIVAGANVHGVDKMHGPTEKLDKDGKTENIEPNAMGLEFVGHGAEETFATITFTNKGAEKCSLHEKPFKVKGKAIATSGPTTTNDQENDESGATLVFSPEHTMQELKLGPEPATFTSILTSKMAEKEGKPQDPIALTTTT